MSPPVLTEERIRDALRGYRRNGAEVQYPATRFYDIDGDSIEEAAVFTRVPPREMPPGINILDQVEGEWISVCEAPAPDSTANIDFVFCLKHVLTDPQTINIVIGWEDTRSSKNCHGLHRYQNGRLTSSLNGLRRIAIADLDSNGTTDLCLLTARRSPPALFGVQHRQLGTVSDSAARHRPLRQRIAGRPPTVKRLCFWRAGTTCMTPSSRLPMLSRRTAGRFWSTCWTTETCRCPS